MGISFSTNRRTRVSRSTINHNQNQNQTQNQNQNRNQNPSPSPSASSSSSLNSTATSLPMPLTNSTVTSLPTYIEDPYQVQPYFNASPIRPLLPDEPDDARRTRIVNSDVNVHKETFKLVLDDMDPDRYLVSFLFDAVLDGSITIYYFAREDVAERTISLFCPETYAPVNVPFSKGLNQEYRQPSGTGIDFRFFNLDCLSLPSSRHDIFPILVSAQTYPSEFIPDYRTYEMPHDYPQVQLSLIVVDKNREEQYTGKVHRQVLYGNDMCYELKDIYGLVKPSAGNDESGSGKECVICMAEQKDIAVLPCRHMCMCTRCAKALSLRSNRCPICREIIHALLEIKVDKIL